jgi:hypothetical protein
MDVRPAGRAEVVSPDDPRHPANDERHPLHEVAYAKLVRLGLRKPKERRA